MTLEYVSEIDKKFFANNLLTNEDWEPSNSMEEGFSDISEFLNLNDDLKSFTAELPDDLMMFKDSPPLADTILDDYWKDLNPTDDDLYGVDIKSEPLSPLSSNCSETGSEGYGSASDNSVHSLATDIKIDEVMPVANLMPVPPVQLPVSSSSTTLTPSVSNNRVFTIIPKQEDNKKTIILNNINGNSVGMLTPVSGGAIKLNNIMNSKIKIQPKPCEIVSTPKPSPPVVKSTSAKPLVLTPEEFNKLTSSGALCFKPPQNAPVAMETSDTISSPAIYESSDMKNVKRQQRMIKNRESASLSRKRKKEYLSTLEVQLNGIAAENQKLKQDNNTLRKKVCALECENERLKIHHGLPITGNKKTNTCLLAVLIMLSINIAPWSLLNTGNSPSNEMIPVHKGRQLMAISDRDNNLRYEPSSGNTWSKPADLLMRHLHKLTEEMSGNSSQTDNGHQMCPTYFNKTESILLAEQLVGWMTRHEEEKQKTQKKKTGRKKVKSLNAALRGDIDAFKMHQRLDKKAYQVQLFNGGGNRQEFLNAIHRRNDTFYVLSFDQDYFLVPATAHNKTMRPRMSLVMPAMALNETMQPPEGSVGMMQIDCEVVSTQLIHVHKSAIPPHHRKNSTYSQYHHSHSP